MLINRSSGDSSGVVFFSMGSSSSELLVDDDDDSPSSSSSLLLSSESLSLLLLLLLRVNPKTDSWVSFDDEAFAIGLTGLVLLLLLSGAVFEGVCGAVWEAVCGSVFAPLFPVFLGLGDVGDADNEIFAWPSLRGLKFGSSWRNILCLFTLIKSLNLDVYFKNLLFHFLLILPKILKYINLALILLIFL